MDIRCSVCKSIKDAEQNYYKSYTSSSGYQDACKLCQCARNKRRRQKLKAQRLGTLEPDIEITVEEPVTEENTVTEQVAQEDHRIVFENPPDFPIIAIGDMHLPWVKQKVLDKIYHLIEMTQPGLVIQLADLYDLFAFSKYPRSHNVMTPREEFRTAHQMANQFWLQVHRLAPNARKIQLMGNHDDRAEKRVIEQLPEAEDMVEDWLTKMYSFPGVEWIKDSKAELFVNSPIGTICFQHGFYSRAGQHAQYNQMNTVHGHDHKAGVLFYQNRHGSYWNLQAGCVIDVEAPVFRYKNQNRINGVQVGVGYIDWYGPRFIDLSR